MPPHPLATDKIVAGVIEGIGLNLCVCSAGCKCFLKVCFGLQLNGKQLITERKVQK